MNWNGVTLVLHLNTLINNPQLYYALEETIVIFIIA